MSTCILACHMDSPSNIPIDAGSVHSPGAHIPTGIPRTHLGTVFQQHLGTGDVATQAGLVES